MSYANVITGEVTKMLEVESKMAIIGRLEAVLAIAMQMMPAQAADRLLKVHFLEREPLILEEK